MQYLLTKEFTKINETSGTIQNPCRIQTIEMSATNEPGSGILIKPNQQHTFQNATIYLRCVNGDNATARVVPFIVNPGGGGSGGSNSGGGSSTIDDSQIATDEQIDDLLDNVFG